MPCRPLDTGPRVDIAVEEGEQHLDFLVLHVPRPVRVGEVEASVGLAVVRRNAQDTLLDLAGCPVTYLATDTVLQTFGPNLTVAPTRPMWLGEGCCPALQTLSAPGALPPPPFSDRSSATLATSQLVRRLRRAPSHRLPACARPRMGAGDWEPRLSNRRRGRELGFSLRSRVGEVHGRSAPDQIWPATNRLRLPTSEPWKVGRARHPSGALFELASYSRVVSSDRR
jgi:hypothetical protein